MTLQKQLVKIALLTALTVAVSLLFIFPVFTSPLFWFSLIFTISYLSCVIFSFPLFLVSLIHPFCFSFTLFFPFILFSGLFILPVYLGSNFFLTFLSFDFHFLSWKDKNKE